MANRSSGTGSKKYQAVHSNYDRLVNQIKPVVGEFARKAFTKNLISSSNKDEASNEFLPRDNRAGKVLGIILDKIEYDDSHFDTLISILREIPTVRQLAEDLSKAVSGGAQTHVQANGTQKGSIGGGNSDAKPKLGELLKELLSKVADEWENIGLILNLEQGELNAVKANERDVRACLREMLKLWLRKINPPPTWSAIIAAIESVGYADVALDLRGKYL